MCGEPLGMDVVADASRKIYSARLAPSEEGLENSLRPCVVAPELRVGNQGGSPQRESCAVKTRGDWQRNEVAGKPVPLVPSH